MHLTFATAALAAVLAAGSPSDDAVLAQAKAHVEAARKAFTKNKFADALKEFKAAQALKPKATLWFNIAKCQEKLNDAPGALLSYRNYLREAPDAPDKREVVTAVSRLEKKLKAKGVQQLLVVTTPPEADVTIEGKGTKPAPAAFELKPGSYTVSISKSGYEPEKRDVSIAKLGSKDLTVVLRPKLETPPELVEPAKPPVAETKPPEQKPEVAAVTPQETKPVETRPAETKPDSPVTPKLTPVVPDVVLSTPKKTESGGRKFTYVAGAVALVGLGVGAGMGASASSARDQLLATQHSQTDADALYDHARSFSTGANVAFGIGAAAAVTTAVLFIVESPSDQGSPSHAPAFTF